MSEETVSFKPHEILPMQCPKCGPTTKLNQAFIALSVAQVVVTCQCGQAVCALELSLASYRQAVLAKLERIDSRIVKPELVPKLN